MNRMKLSILGTRGIPAGHGGFETFAQRLAPYLVWRGHEVTVYCQQQGRGAPHEDHWQGVRRVHIPVPGDGAGATVLFDLKSVLHAARESTTVLVLGYNTAVFCGLFRLLRRRCLINMDGLEWQRDKWGLFEQAWLYANERLGCWFADRLIADHPEIARHLATRVSAAKIATIPYGADRVDGAVPGLLKPFDLEPGGYALVIARPEPENSIVPIVSAFSQRPRGIRLVVLGHYEPAKHPYHALVMQAAGPEVVFPGAIYDAETVAALRYHARLYVHGHTVGGTNPSLVEALGAGLPVLAHGNRFNRWVAGPEARYFRSTADCARQLAVIDDAAALERMRQASRRHHAEAFQWDQVLRAYENLLLMERRRCPARGRAPGKTTRSRLPFWKPRGREA